MSDIIRDSQRLILAAGTDGRVTFSPPGSEVWEVQNLTVSPNATSAANGTNYASNQWFKGASTAVTAAVTTETVALTQGTPVAGTISAVGADKEVSASSPLSFRSDQSNGSGVAVDLSVSIKARIVRQ